MKKFAWVSSVLALFFTGTVVAQEKYNVLFIAADGLNPSVLSAYGNKFANTPYTQQLANRGTTFENAFCQQSSCAPSRASLMTGYRPDTLEINSGTEHFRDRFPDVVTFPQLFQKNGYYTQAIGLVSHAHPAQPDDVSWNLPESLLDIPKRDEYLLPTNRVRGFINRMEKGTATEGVDAPDNAYQDGQVAQLTIETLEKIKDKPFLLAVGFKRPHLPFTAPKKYWDMYDPAKIPMPVDPNLQVLPPEIAELRYGWGDTRGEMRAYTDMPKKGPLSQEQVRQILHGYYASVSYVDYQIGRILNALDSLQLTEKTIIVLWSDHGYHLGERGLWGKNDLTDDANRIPLIIVKPGSNKKNQRTKALVETADMYATITDLAGLPQQSHLQGVSAKPLLENPDLKWKRAIFNRYPRAGGKIMGRSVRTAEYRYSEFVELATGRVIDRELYEINKDPQQYNNLVDKKDKKQIVDQLKKTLDAGWRSVVIDK